jgi:membrane dipeptidase
LRASQGGWLRKTSRTTALRIAAEKFGYMPFAIETQVAGGESYEFLLETVHAHFLVADLHNDVLEKMIEAPYYHLADYHTYNHTDIPRLKAGGVDVQLFVIWVTPSWPSNGWYNRAMAMADLFHDEMLLNVHDIGQACTTADVAALQDDDKISAVLCVEGGHVIENSIEKLIALYEEGMRYLTITWNNSTDWAVSAQDTRSATVGLSEFGGEVIRTLDSLGVMIDISHTGKKTKEDILDISTKPIIASHSGVRALRNHYRNLYDDQIIALANTGGMIGVVFYPPYLSSATSVSIATVVHHIDYIANLVGVDYVGLGSDFDGIGTNTVNGLEDVSKFPDLILELLRRNYSPEEIEKILGGNFMRVFEEVCGN